LSRNNNLEKSDARWFRLFTAPWLIGFLLLSLAPMILGFVISLTNYNGVSPNLARFIGFANYARAFTDPNVGEAALRTLVLLLIYVPSNLFIGLSLALLINAGPRARGFFRSLYYLPSIIPIVGAAFIWRAMLNGNSGIVNNLLAAINPNWKVNWLIDFATPSLVSMSLWLALGLSTVLYVAALQTVPPELEQAALMDGATYLQRLRHVVFPLISPVVFYQVLIAIIYALGVVAEPLLLGGSSSGQNLTNVPNANVVLNVYTYQQMFLYQRFGYAAAILWLTFAGAVAVTIGLFATRKYWVHSESGNI